MLHKEENIDNPQLFTHFGTNHPHWRVTSDSDAMQLSGELGAASVSIVLTSKQASTVRGLGGVTSSFVLDLAIFGTPVRLHLVGRKTDVWAWGGTAARYDDTENVASDLGKSLTFAEKVVTEVNSLVIILDSSGKIKRFNRLCEEVTGLREIDVLGKNAHELFVPGEVRDESWGRVSSFFENGQCHDMVRAIRTLDGERIIHWRNTMMNSANGVEETYLVCSGTDVTEERKAQARLFELANTDVLTGLLSRHAIEERINTEITSQARPFGVIFLDLDNFKKINDHYGHLTGDALIQQVATAIKGCLEKDDVLARLGGDEFLVLVASDSLPAVSATAQRIQERMKSPFRLAHAEVHTSCSIGIAMFPEHGGTREELVRSADTAMYVAKEQGRGLASVFNPEMNAKVGEYIWLDNNPRSAIEKQQFELYYQPKVSLRTGKVDSVEALLRWNHPERGVVSPDEFISYAEESGLIIPIGLWALGAAAKQAAQWRMQGLNLRIAVNVSARQLKSPNVIDEFTRAILSNGASPAMIDLELTESCLLEDEKLAHGIIRDFRDLGVQVHLDDFGTGYSSLSQLTRLPLDVIKLDGLFITSIHTDTRAQALVRSMVAVGHELNLKIVAECVETPEQASFLREIGVDYAQGYLYGHPMAITEFSKWMPASSNKVLRLVA